MIPDVLKPYLLYIRLTLYAAFVAAVWINGNVHGHKIERADTLKRDNSALVLANKQITELNAAVRATEHAKSEAVAAVATEYERKLADDKTESDKRIAAVRAGAIKLRDPGTHVTASNSAGQAPADTSGRSGQTGCQLSVEASEFLFRLTSEADEVVDQLDACQSILVQDRANEQ